MANIDKNIVITPNISNTSEPKIVFTGGNNNPTTLRVLDDGTISFEGGAGQLFSISNTATGQIFAVNDISGYPLSEVYSNGYTTLARSYGRVVLGSNATPTASMTIQGNNATVGLQFVGQGGNNAGFMTTPAGVRFVSVGSSELALLGLASLRFSDSVAYSYDSWGGIRWISSNNTMIVGGPGASGLPNNNVVSANLIMHNATTGNFMVANASATNLFVGANGNVGIGNSTPNYNLSVQGTARIDSTVSVGGSGTFSIDAPNISNGRLIVTADPTGNATNGSPNANVGIGVVAPIYKLQVNGAVGFVNSSATQVLFAANGNVGIGNTTPDDRLEVNGNINYSGTAYATQATLTDGATISWTTTNAQVATVTLAGNRTVAAPTGMINGAFYALAVIQDATGGRTLAWNAVFKWTFASAPTLTTTANARDYFVFRSDGTNMYEQGRALGVA